MAKRFETEIPMRGLNPNMRTARIIKANKLLLEYDQLSEQEKLNKQKRVIEQFLGPSAYDNAVSKRGAAYIKAQELIFENCEPPIFEQNPASNAARYQQLKDKQDLAGSWQQQKALNKNALKGLSQLLAEKLQAKAFGKQKKIERIVSKDLCNAENHCSWGKREPLAEVIQFDAQTYQVRIDEPITRFTKRQEQQWLKILDKKKPPKWFKDLSTWEKNYFTKRILEWQKINKTHPINLGDFLGVPPTTIRGYPGARNASRSFFYTYKKDGQGNFILTNTAFKIRSGHLSPDKMKNKEERLDAAKENLKQLILAHAEALLMQGKTNILVDLQTLISPPYDYTMDNDRLAAVSAIRKELKGKGFANFLKQNGIKIPKDKEINLTLITSNYPVNKFRALSNFLSAISSITRNWENAKVLRTLRNEARKQRAQYEKNKSLIPDLKDNDLRMAEAALAKIEEISGPLQRLSNLFKRGMNHNAERAALEQIAVSGLGGIRIGSCMSGKDREGAVSEHMAAMTAFYAKYNKLPPIPGKFTRRMNDEEKALRKEYEKMVAMEFLAGYEQKIAEANAPGANGLKNVKHVLGKRILEQIKKLLVEKYFKDSSEAEKAYWQNLDVNKLTNKIASLNRIKESDKNSTYQTLSKIVGEDKSGKKMEFSSQHTSQMHTPSVTTAPNPLPPSPPPKNRRHLQ